MEEFQKLKETANKQIELFRQKIDAWQGLIEKLDTVSSILQIQEAKLPNGEISPVLNPALYDNPIDKYKDYNQDAKPAAKVLYLIEKTGRAVKLPFVKDLILKIEGPKQGNKTIASLNYVFNILVKNGKLIGVKHGGSKHYIFYGLPSWKSDNSSVPWKSEHLANMDDFRQMSDSSINMFEWLASNS